jgi:hydroxymethylpyrimidine pyrophosphatase-like HAD family hydrolase
MSLMIRPPLRLISTDFDGTIHEDFSDSPIPLGLQERLAQFQAAGTLWVINTGREMASLMESMGRAQVRVRPDYLILVEREVFRNDHGHYVPLEPWNTRCTRDHAQLFADLASEIAQVVEGLSKQFDATFYEDPWSPLCVIARSNAQMDAIEVQLAALCAQHPRLIPVRNDVYIRLSHMGYSKGTALGELQRILDIRPGDTLAAGDHLNDLPMLDPRFAQHLVAPSNAIPRVREQVLRFGGQVRPERAGHAVLAALDGFVPAQTP